MKKMIFFLGKGGVGKSTLSTACSCRLSQDMRVLHVSLDPAHNIGDIYGISLSDSKTAVHAHLDALEVNMQYWIARYLKESKKEMKAHYNYASTINLDSFFNILKYSPGTEEFAVLWAIESIYEKHHESYDAIIFDTPPTALTLRFLAMPSISIRWVKELSSLREKILEKRQTIMKLNPENLSPQGTSKKEDDKVYTKLSSISQRLHLLYDLFTKESYFTVILNDDTLSFSETLRIREELGKLDLPIHSLNINKVRSTTDLSRIVKEFTGCPLFTTGQVSGEISSPKHIEHVGVDDLLEHIRSS